MRVTLCGTGQSMLNPQRAGAAIVVEEAGRALLLDCGPGSLERLAAAGISLTGIEAAWLSHLHFDHAMGMAEWLTRLAFAGEPLPPIYGPRGTAEYVEGRDRLCAHPDAIPERRAERGAAGSRHGDRDSGG